MKKEFLEKYPTFLSLSWLLGDSITQKLNDYENKILKDPSYKKKLLGVDHIYMHSIVLDMAILLGVVKNDTAGLEQLKSICPSTLQDSIKVFQETYKDTIEKIKQNRNRIISHMDTSADRAYFDLKFSQEKVEECISWEIAFLSRYAEVGEVEKADVERRWKALKAKSKTQERYTPADFEKEVSIFRAMVAEIKDIIQNRGMKHWSDLKKTTAQALLA